MARYLLLALLPLMGFGVPAVVGEVVYEEDNFRVEVDRSEQVLRLTLPEDIDYTGDGAGEKVEAPLLARLPKWSEHRLVSASILAQKAKVFDDGLLAAVELAAQEGISSLDGKRELLAQITAALRDADAKTVSEPTALVWAAAKLGDDAFQIPTAWDEQAQTILRTFLAGEKRSKPLGFYTWSPELEAIFRQDRLLQTPLTDPDGISALVTAIGAQETARVAYERHLALMHRLTNPSRMRSLLDVLEKGVTAEEAARDPGQPIAFFPPSASVETQLVLQLFGPRPPQGGRPIPEDFNVFDEVIERLRDGRIDPAPDEDSGWYDLQFWAAAPLVTPEETPEAKHLEFGPRYRQQLAELFKAIMSLSRESHVKQLESPSAGAQLAVFIHPDLGVEPTATHYLRRAAGYRFVRGVLEDVLGADALLAMKRLSPTGRVAISVDEELRQIESLFFGAYATAMRQLGGTPESGLPLNLGNAEIDAAVDQFNQWRQKLDSDADLGQDLRMMVPVYYDEGRKMTKVWCFLGWTERPLRIEFVKRPKVKVVGEPGDDFDPDRDIVFDSDQEQLYYPVTAEVYVSQLMDRDEFRAHCDRYRTRTAILENLPARDAPGGGIGSWVDPTQSRGVTTYAVAGAVVAVVAGGIYAWRRGRSDSPNRT